MKSAMAVRAALALAASGAVLAGAAERGAIAYPEGYRGWSHVKSMVIEKGHPLFDAFGGIHHLYANRQAMEGYRSGRFPNGAVIVFDLLEAPADGNAVSEGSRKVLAVMQRDAARFKDTGGWGFEGFAGGDRAKRVVTDGGKSCFTCHVDKKQTDYVFSAWRE